MCKIKTNPGSNLVCVYMGLDLTGVEPGVSSVYTIKTNPGLVCAV